MSLEELIETVDDQIIKVRTKNMDVSFNELYEMYKSEELFIAPEYQRLFRWDEEKQSRFIETLILEMPVPPIYVIEKKDGEYELIDGLQRISSYLHFRGEKLINGSENPEIDESGVEPVYSRLDDGQDINSTESSFFKLIGCDIVPELNGHTFESMPKALQIKLKRTFIRLEVIKKESDPNLKYHIFKRLNTGGELLTDQEIRNCTIRLLNSKAIDFIKKCSENIDFKEVIQKIGVNKFYQKYDQELVLRYFAIKNNVDEYKYPVSEYLTNFMEFMSDDNTSFDYSSEEVIFNKTFQLINKTLGDSAFSPLIAGTKPKNQFVLYYFDGIAGSFCKLYSQIEKENYDKIGQKINDIKNGTEIKSYTTGNKSSVVSRIELFEKGVREVIE